MIPAMLVLNIIPEFHLDFIPLDTIPFSHSISNPNGYLLLESPSAEDSSVI